MTSDTTAATETVPYFFFLRLEWNVERGRRYFSCHGVMPLARGTSRLQVFLGLCERARAEAGVPSDADVTAFTLEPDLI